MTPERLYCDDLLESHTAGSPLMSRKSLVALCVPLVAGWGIFALSYATARPTEGGLGVFVLVGVTFTCFAGLLIVLAWTEGEGQERAAFGSFLAMVVILFLAALHAMGWNF